MSINPKEKAFFEGFLKKINSADTKSIADKSLAECRADVASIIWLLKKPEHLNYIEDRVIARDGHLIPIRIFNAHLPSNTPVIFYLLGNGFIYEQYEVNTYIASRIADYSGYKVVMANPRLAPENPLPSPILDFFDVMQTLLKQNHAIKLSPSHCIVVGYCSGASAACTVAAMENRNFKIDQLILLNGIYDYTFKNRDYIAFENQDLSFAKEFMDFILKHQQINEAYQCNPLYSPMHSHHFASYPPTTIIVAEYDRNRSSSEALYTKMSNAKANVKKITLSGQTHNTIIFYESIQEGIDPAKVIAELALLTVSFI